MTYVQIITVVHTALSLLALGVGIVAVSALFREQRRGARAFLWLAFATSLTGFFFPFNGVTPAFLTGIVALAVLLAVVLAAGRVGRMSRGVYAGGMVASLYFLVFVAVAQAFQKVPPLRALAPTGAEPPFAVAELAVLLAFLWIGWRAVRQRAPAPIAAGSA